MSFLRDLWQRLLDKLKRKQEPQTTYSELKERVAEKPKTKGRNRRERRMLAHIRREGLRGKAKRQRRADFIARQKTPRQRILNALSGPVRTGWQARGRSEEALQRLAKHYGIWDGKENWA